MNSGPLERSVKDVATAHPEVEFALVLARMIDSVSADPQQLRSAVYELARHKLDQLGHDDPAEKQRLMTALEVAIDGVESHTQNNPVDKLGGPFSQPFPRGEADPTLRLLDGPIGPFRPDPVAAASDPVPPAPLQPRRRRWLASTPVRVIAVLLFIWAVVAIVVMQRHGGVLTSARETVAGLVAPAPPPLPQKSETPAASQAPATPVPDAGPKRLLPTAYGVYAENNDKLFELQMLQGRAPDPRVAISAAITKPSDISLPDGHVRFIVFRRENAADAADSVEVRIVARINQVTTFDAKGKPVVSSSNDEQTWVIRNISIPFRSAPLKEDPQMFEVLPRDADAPLGPGRYALVIKNQAYDFTVQGAITDKRHCLQRLSAANGTFYSECDKP